jgi:hypothetical protein
MEVTHLGGALEVFDQSLGQGVATGFSAQRISGFARQTSASAMLLEREMRPQQLWVRLVHAGALGAQVHYFARQPFAHGAWLGGSGALVGAEAGDRVSAFAVQHLKLPVVLATTARNAIANGTSYALTRHPSMAEPLFAGVALLAVGLPPGMDSGESAIPKHWTAKDKLRLTLFNIVMIVPTLLIPIAFWPSMREAKAPFSDMQATARPEEFDSFLFEISSAPLAFARLYWASSRDTKVVSPDANATANMADSPPSLLFTATYFLVLFAVILGPLFWPSKRGGKTPISHADAPVYRGGLPTGSDI